MSKGHWAAALTGVVLGASIWIAAASSASAGLLAYSDEPPASGDDDSGEGESSGGDGSGGSPASGDAGGGGAGGGGLGGGGSGGGGSSAGGDSSSSGSSGGSGGGGSSGGGGGSSGGGSGGATGGSGDGGPTSPESPDNSLDGPASGDPADSYPGNDSDQNENDLDEIFSDPSLNPNGDGGSSEDDYDPSSNVPPALFQPEFETDLGDSEMPDDPWPGPDEEFDLDSQGSPFTDGYTGASEDFGTQSFDSQSVPEPSSMAIYGLGGALVFAFHTARRRRTRRKAEGRRL